MQCLELFQYKKFTLSIRESCQIEKDQLAILRQHLANGGDTTLEQQQASYAFDYMKPSTRWALAELAKTVQHIANISCLPKEEMQVRLKRDNHLFIGHHANVCYISIRHLHERA